MPDMTLTDLRRNLFRVADRVVKTGTPVRIRRRGRTLTLTAETSGSRKGRLKNLKRRSLIAGDASTLWRVKVGQWRGHREIG